MTIPSFTLEATSDPNLSRLCDINGDWEYYYFHKEDRYVPAVTRVLSIGYPKDKRFHEYLLSTTKEEARKKLEAKGDEGSRTHEAITMIIEGKRVSMQTKLRNRETKRMEYLTMDEMENLTAYTNFCNAYSPRKLTYEFTLGDLEADMAGTLDWLGAITVPYADRKTPKHLWGKTIAVLLDWKTSAGIYDEYGLQTSIYHRMAKNHPKLRKFFSVNEVYTGIVRIGTKHADGYEIEIYTPEQTEKNYKTAQCAKWIHDTKSTRKFVPDIRQIQAEFKVRMPLLPLSKNVNDTTPKKPTARVLPPVRLEEVPAAPKNRAGKKADNGRPVRKRR